jgi:fibronectin-binding autotransporter adhesin
MLAQSLHFMNTPKPDRKNLKSNHLCLATLSLCGILAMPAQTARATFTTWDPQGTTGGTITSPTSGGYTGNMSQTWENAEWSTLTTQAGMATPTNWVENTAALFAVQANGNTPAFTVTMNANHTVAGIFDGPENPDPCTVTITGAGQMILSGNQGFDVTSDTGDPGSLTISNVIAGSGGEITWQGSGSFVLYGANTYTGGFVIAGSGGVSFGNNSAFGTGTITWSTGGFIQPAQASVAYTITNPMTHLADTIETFSGNSAGTTFSGNWSLGSTGYVELENIADTITVSGPIGGSAILVLTNRTGGAWTLTGVNTFTNNLTNACALTIGGSGSIGSGNYPGAIMNYNSITYGSSGTQTLSGVIAGAGSLTNTTGKLILSGLNTFTGDTTIKGGTVQVNSLDTPGTKGPLGNFATNAAGSIILTGGTLQYSSANAHDYSGRFSTAANQQYNIDVNGQGVTFATALTSSGGALSLVDSAGGGTLTLNDDNTYTGNTTITSGTIALGTFATPFGATNGTVKLAGGKINVTLNRGTTGTENILNPLSITGASIIEAATTTGSRFITFGGPVSSTGGSLTILNNETTNGPGLFCVVFTNAATVGVPIAITNTTAGDQAQLCVWNFSNVGDQVYNGIISGPGSIFRSTELAAGTGARVIFNATNTYSGGTSNNDGEIACGVSSSGPADSPTNGPIGTGPMTIGNSNARISAYGGPQVVGNHVIVASSPFTFTGSNSLTMSGNFDFFNGVRTLNVLNTNLTALTGSISNGGLVVAGGNTLTLAGNNPYVGSTVISNNSTLLLTNTGSINNSTNISIQAGSTLDVSSMAAYSLSASSTLTASGAASPATINGASGGTVSLGSQPIVLTYNGTNPALTISQGSLVLNGNAITVNGPVLSPGYYNIIQQAAGSITASGSFSVNGTAIGAGETAFVVITSTNSTNVTMGIQATPSFSAITPSPSETYGATSVTLTGTLSATSPSTVYPAMGEIITVTINGNSQTTTINDSSGDFSINYNPSSPANLPVSGSPYTITYAYGGDTSLGAAMNTATALAVLPASLTVTAVGVNKNYDGTTAATVMLSDNRVAGDVLTDGYASAVFASAGPGAGIAVSVSGINISGPASGNYTLANTTAATSATILTPGATWVGADFATSPNWSDGANWLSGTPPDLVGDMVDFGGTAGLMPVMNNSYAVYTLTFDSTAGSFVLTNAGGTVLSVDVGVTNNSTNAQFLAMPVALLGASASSWRIFTNGAPLTVSGAISDSGGGLNVSGSGLLELTGGNSFTGPISNAAGIRVDVGGSGVLGTGDYETNIIDNGTLSYSSSAAQALSGTISGSGSLVENGSGALTLSATNTYSGNTAINGGTLLLAATGSISDTSSLSIAAGGTFDVSSQSAYSFGGTTLFASGAQPALINGASGGTVTIFSAITLNYDGTDPALTIAEGTLVLSNNAFVVNTASVLPAGSYTLITQSNGMITDLSGTYPVPTGTAFAPGTTNWIVVVNARHSASVVLTIQSNTTTAVSSSTGGTSSYGQPVTFSATVSNSDGGGTVAFYLDGSLTPIPGCSSLPLVAGVATTPAMTNLNVGSHTITAAYSGDALSTSSSGTLVGGQTVTTASQSLTFGSLANETYGVAPFGISATASSGLPVSFAVISGPVSIAGSTVTVHGAGTALIQASQPGNSNYSAAIPLTNSLTVNPLPVVLAGSRAYDGTATANYSILAVADPVGSDVVNLASGAATLASTSVGTNAITSVGTLTLGGAASANYTLSGATGSVTITNPFNPFSITSYSLDVTGTNFVVCWQSVPGVVYRVLTNTSLAPPQSWAPTGSPVTATNTTTCFTLPGGSPATNAFVVIKQ